MCSMWHPILMMETEKVLEIVSFCSCGPQRLNEITVLSSTPPFLPQLPPMELKEHCPV